MSENRAQQFWDKQAVWSNATFGDEEERGPLGPLKHLEKEAKESQGEAQWLVDNPNGDWPYIRKEEVQSRLEMEIADCLFLTFDAARRARMTLDSLLDTAFQKLEINKKRQWGPRTADGPVEHVR